MGFSHDGTLLAAAGKEGRLIVWNTSNLERLEMLWQLSVHEPPVNSNEIMYVEFSPDDRFLLASVSVQRQNFDASAIVCNSKTGTVLLIVQDLFLNVFATWYSNSWIVTSYFYGTLGGLFIITILDVGNIKEGTCINQSVHMYQSKVDVVCVMFDYHNIRQLQHCRIIRPRQHQTVLFCQLNMDDVDHFASVKIASDANSKPLTHRQGNDVMESPQDQFDGIVALDHHSHACGIVLSRDESKLIASVVTERLEAVKLCIYDVVTLQLLHTLPSDNMARPSSSYYLFPSVTEEVITW